jgi:hypothetical protein
MYHENTAAGGGGFRSGQELFKAAATFSIHWKQPTDTLTCVNEGVNEPFF